MRIKWMIFLLLLGLMSIQWQNSNGQVSGVSDDPFAPPDLSESRWNSRPSDERPTEAYLRTLSGGYSRSAKPKYEGDLKKADASVRTTAGPKAGAARPATTETPPLPFSPRGSAGAAGVGGLTIALITAAIAAGVYFRRRRGVKIEEPPPLIIAMGSRKRTARPMPSQDKDTRPLRRAA